MHIFQITLIDGTTRRHTGTSYADENGVLKIFMAHDEPHPDPYLPPGQTVRIIDKITVYAPGQWHSVEITRDPAATE